MSRNLRVLMTADTVGGVWCYATELMRALSADGIEFLLATMGAPLTPAQRCEVDTLGNVEVAESCYKLEWMENPWSDTDAAGEWLLSLEKTFEPDVIHLNGYVHGALQWRAPTILVGHSCVLSWWRGVKGGHAPAEWLTYETKVMRGLRAADILVAPSRSMAESLHEFYGPLSAVEVIANGVRAEQFSYREKEDFILSAGRLWDEAKNVRAVCACSLSWPICVAGETQHPNGTAPAADLQKVRSLGKLTRAAMVEWFSRARIYALPACYEPFGLSILEAALSRCALVLGDIPSLRENWNGAALFVDPHDRAELESVLNQLIADRDRCDQLGRAARDRGLHFPIRRTAELYLELYQRAQDHGAAHLHPAECLTV